MASRPLAAGAAVSGMHRSRPLARLPPGADLFSRKARAHVRGENEPARALLPGMYRTAAGSTLCDQ